MGFLDNKEKLIIRIEHLNPQYDHVIVFKKVPFSLLEIQNVSWKEYSVLTNQIFHFSQFL
jgi:hypothetical protein